MNGLALCAGIGGIELGLKLAMGKSYRTVCYVEREAFAAAVLVARMEDETLDPAPIWDDLTTFDGRPWRGKVDLISAGFPCQPFSTAKREPGISRGLGLWPQVDRIISEVEPKLVFLENVRTAPWRQIIIDLAACGYVSKTADIAAASVGAPHKRWRRFLLAYADHEREQPMPFHDEMARLEEAPTDWWAELRMADGLPYRVDQLRALGNGVVPLVAAHAWRTLT